MVTWERIKEINRIIQLPSRTASCGFRVTEAPDGLPAFFPRRLYVGRMRSAYKTVFVKLTNPGRSPIRIGEALSSHPTRAVWLKVPSGAHPLNPGKTIELPILIRAAGLGEGEYSTITSLGFQCGARNAYVTIEILFTVLGSRIFRFDVYPMVVVRQPKREAKVLIECCNHSDVPGNLLVEHWNFPNPVPEKQIALHPREAACHAVTMAGEEPIHSQSPPQLIFRDLQSGTYFAVPFVNGEPSERQEMAT
jgi:hypothetical protein